MQVDNVEDYIDRKIPKIVTYLNRAGSDTNNKEMLPL